MKKPIKIKAYVLLLSILCLVFLIGVSGMSMIYGCYFFEPDWSSGVVNTPPVIDLETLEPPIEETVELNLDEVSYQSFVIQEIYDPDNEESLYGAYAIDYTGDVFIGGGIQNINRVGDRTVDGMYIWRAEFKIQVGRVFRPGCHEVIAVISDREWQPLENFFALPAETEGSFVRWKIKAYHGDPSSVICSY